MIAFYNWRSKTEPTRGVSITTPPEATQNQVGTLGISWDVRGDSRTVLKVFGGRFYLDPMLDMTETANPVGVAARRFVFTDRNGNKLLDEGELGAQLSTSGGAGKYHHPGGTPTIVRR